MYVPAQSNNILRAHYRVVDWQTPYGVVNIVKLTENKQDIGSRGARSVVLDSERIQGGNWKMQGFRRSGQVHDEDECQMSIAEFMAEQTLQQDSYDA